MDVKQRRLELLNRLDEMQRLPYYASARQTLRHAELLIVQLEQEVAALKAQSVQPVDMVLHCPQCRTQHIDAPEDLHDIEGGCDIRGCSPWNNTPHKSHLCHACGCIWRPADVPTNGVAATKTKGKNDSYPVAQPVQDQDVYRIADNCVQVSIFNTKIFAIDADGGRQND